VTGVAEIGGESALIPPPPPAGPGPPIEIESGTEVDIGTVPNGELVLDEGAGAGGAGMSEKPLLTGWPGGGGGANDIPAELVRGGGWIIVEGRG